MMGCMVASGQLPGIGLMAGVSIILALAVAAAELRADWTFTGLLLAAGGVAGFGLASVLA